MQWSPTPALAPNADIQQILHSALKEQFGEQAVTDLPRLLAYSYDATGERHWPDAVVIATNSADVQKVMHLAAKFSVPVIGRGSGSNLSGGTLPVMGGIVISMAHWKAPTPVDALHREVTARSGTVNGELQDSLGAQGYFFPPDPASHRISTLGGNVAEGSGGPHCVKYGTTSHYVRRLQAVLADGSLVHCPGAWTLLDWAGIITGSEGVLAIIVEVVLGILPRPKSTGTMLAGFGSLTTAMQAVSAIIRAHIIPSTLELLDKSTLDTVRPFINAGYPEREAVLLIEVDGSEDTVQSQKSHLQSLLEAAGAEPVISASSPRHAEALMAARRSAYGAAARLSAHLWVQDVTVPRPKLAEMMEGVLEIASRYQIPISTVAHAGDGNLHPLIPFDPDNLAQMARIKEADSEILRQAAELGGSITGEHGIGIDKLPALPLMYTLPSLIFMTQIKRAFDPRNLLNPAKAVFPCSPSGSPSPSLSIPAPVAKQSPPHSPTTPLVPQSEEDLQRMIRDLAAPGHSLSLRPSARHQRTLQLHLLNRITDLDEDNMTVSVQAGITLRELNALLDAHDMAFPVAGFFPDQSLGALVSQGLPHMLQWGYGPLKNWILAVRVLDGHGEYLDYGKKVMKNVAGLDMTKLYIGSLGRLGLITRITVRTIPKSSASAAVQIPMEALARGALDNFVTELASLPLGPQGLWITQGQLTLYMDGADLPAKMHSVRKAASANHVLALEADGVRCAQEAQALVSGAASYARQQGSALYFSSGSAQEHALYSLADGVLRISGTPPAPSVLQSWRCLDSAGWHVEGHLDNALATVQNRILQAADPYGLYANLC